MHNFKSRRLYHHFSHLSHHFTQFTLFHTFILSLFLHLLYPQTTFYTPFCIISYCFTPFHTLSHSFTPTSHSVITLSITDHKYITSFWNTWSICFTSCSQSVSLCLTPFIFLLNINVTILKVQQDLYNSLDLYVHDYYIWSWTSSTTSGAHFTK